MSDFLKISRVGLQDRPQQLEKIGVAAPARRASRPSATTTTPAAAPLIGAMSTAGIMSEPILLSEVAATVPAEQLTTVERRNGRVEINRRRR